MQRLECLAAECVYNIKGKCRCPNVKMSAKPAGARCGSYEGLPNYRMALKGDVEMACDFDAAITCSAENCVFNVHYSCKAGNVKVDGYSKTCRSYYGM